MSRIVHYLFYHKYSIYFFLASTVLALALNEQLIKFRPAWFRSAINQMARIVAYTKEWKSSRLSILQEQRTAVLRRSFQEGHFDPVWIGDHIEVDKTFSVEAVIKPEREQGAYAHIVGNHPGFNYFEGFAIQQEGQNTNIYTFGFGNGRKWLPPVRFPLEADRWNYLAVVVEENRVRIYLDGVLATSQDVEDSIRNSGMPLFVGDWVDSGRVFKGLVAEVQICQAALSEKVIAENQKRAQLMALRS